MKVAYSSIFIALTGLVSLIASVDAAVVGGRLLAATFRGRVTRGVSLKTKVLLGGGRYQTQIARDGTFEFPDVPVGTYILEVQSPHLVYSRPPEGQKVVGFFSNPMILMASFSIIMLLIMPRIMANLDADALDALRSSYDFSSLPALSPQHLGLMVPPHQSSSFSSSSSSISSSSQMQHQAYAMDDSHSHDFFLDQSTAAPYYSEKSHVDFATPSDNSTVSISRGLYQAYPATFGDQWAQQQAAVEGSTAPIQTKKQK
ncbi:hypothetical protein BGZ47_009092 [Haplosporangium gracile]|nr:hypothetical protein BGZ47_009092 [Haplosporangium gracile]